MFNAPFFLSKLVPSIIFCFAITNVYSDNVRNSSDIASGDSDFATYLYFAKLAQIAYEPKSKINDYLKNTNYRLTLHNILPNSKVSYFLITDIKNKKHIISIQGTANIENVLVNAKMKLVLNTALKIKLHQGFAESAFDVFREIKPSLNDDYTISTTGHSLGGAIAFILAMFLDVDQYKVEKTITFGQPKVSNFRGANRYSHIDLIRFVTPLDIVPLIPPLDISDIRNIDIFWHSGTEKVLYPGKNFATLTGIKSMLRATNIFSTKMGEKNLEHHKMVLYVKLLEEKQDSSVQIPYKRGFSVLEFMRK